MKNIAFKKVLFRAAFSVMACDGEIHESEVAELKDMAENSLYFDGLDHEIELNELVNEMRLKGSQAIKEFFTLIEQWGLSEKQEFQMIEVLVRIVEADDKVDNSELHFIHNIRRHLKISDESLIVSFPRHVGLLIGLEHHGEADIQPGLQGLDFGNVDNLFTSS